MQQYYWRHNGGLPWFDFHNQLTLGRIRWLLQRICIFWIHLVYIVYQAAVCQISTACSRWKYEFLSPIVEERLYRQRGFILDPETSDKQCNFFYNCNQILWNMRACGFGRTFSCVTRSVSAGFYQTVRYVLFLFTCTCWFCEVIL